MESQTGRVKFFNTKKGFGFIIRENNSDVFFHFKDLLDDVQTDDLVEFELSTNSKGIKATNVKLLK